MNKLDLKTKLFLYITKAKIASLNLEQKIDIPNERKNEVYVFDNYEEYVKYFHKYLKHIDENLIKKAIYTTGKHGQIIAFKGLCERIIVKQRTQEFYDTLTQTKIDEIHKKGKLTPYDKVEEYEKNDLCAPGESMNSANNRCKFFNNCHECLLEYVSHNQEYNEIEYKIVNSLADKNEITKKLKHY